MLGRARSSREQAGRWQEARRQALKELRQFAQARRLESPHDRLRFDVISARYLRPGDCVLVLADDMLPADGEILDGAARIDESVLIGVSEPMTRSASTAAAAHVAAGTRLVSGWLVVGVGAAPGDCLLGHLVDGRKA